MPGADDLAEQVLVEHQHTSTSGCICGRFGNKVSDLGRSHPRHVLAEMRAAGLVVRRIEEVPDARV